MMGDTDDACMVTAFAFCVKTKKKKHLLGLRHFFSELSIVFISFLKFGAWGGVVVKALRY